MNEIHPVKVCFGMTLYNRSDYLPEALESLLNQSWKDFKIVAVDDCSNDGTEEIMRAYVERDERITYIRNPTHEGMIATWRKAFFEAYERHRPEYFAWASDHDRWETSWLERHIAALDAHPESVLAYCSVKSINASGEAFETEIPPFIDTHELDYFDHLLQACINLRGAGYAVYGLFRTVPLLKAGVFRRVLLPDRLLITELAAYGKFYHIPEVLWHRRFFGPPPQLSDLLQSQKEKLFGSQDTPLHIHTPFLSHVVSLLVNLVLDQPSKKSIFISRGLIIAGLVWEKRRKYIIKEIDRIVSEDASSPFFNPEESKEAERFKWLIVLVLALQQIRDRNLNEWPPFYQIATKAITQSESRHSIKIKETHNKDSVNSKTETIAANCNFDEKQQHVDGFALSWEVNKFQSTSGYQTVFELLEEAGKSIARENVLQNELRLKLLKFKNKIDILRQQLSGYKERIQQLKRENTDYKKEIATLNERLKRLEEEKAIKRAQFKFRIKKNLINIFKNF